MAVHEITMPDLGEGLTESDLVAWHVAVGDTVELNQVIAEVETAKALVQLPSPFAGVVSRLFVEPGTTVAVGSPILAIAVDDGGQDGADHGGQEADDGEAATDDVGRDDSTRERTSVLVGYGPPVDHANRPRRRPRAGVRGGGRPAPPTRSSAPAQALAPAERPRSFPPVRRLAHELGVDLSQVTGSGDGGLITREDVLAWKAERRGLAPADRSAGPSTQAREVRTPITGVRRRTAEAMVASAFTAPHATEFLTVDVTPTLELIDVVSGDKRFAGRRVTILTMVAKALLIALRRSPTLNSRWDEDAGEIVQYGYVNLGIAVATPRGLLVPNVKEADRLDLADLADALTALTQAARSGSTSPADLTGGTISITNIGVFGIDAGTPILNPGEAAILAMGAVRRVPWEHQDEIALRQVMTLSLSFDHRLADGEEASRFLADVGEILARPGMTVTMV